MCTNSARTNVPRTRTRQLLSPEGWIRQGGPGARQLASAVRGSGEPCRPISPCVKADSGFDKTAFAIDWGNEQAICPRGATSVSWTELHISGHTYLQARFAERDCRPCPDRARCTSSATGSRSIAVLPQALHEIQMRNRLDQQTEQWQRRYAIRAGIESTLSQNVRAHGLRRSRYRGLTRTHVQHVLTAMACNLSRLANWHDTTSSTRRAARFQTLCTAAGFTII
ncbi:MAG: transposase [Streptomyces sp.]